MGALPRVVFLGSDAIALPLLDWLAGAEGRGEIELAGIFTGPDRPAGRGQRLQPNPVGAWALGRPCPVLKPERLDAAALASLAALAPDVALVVAYGHLLPDAFIAVPRLGTLNLHASLLPAYRGASPIQSAVAGGDRETGMTLMRIVRRLDAGPVADVERVPIGPLDTAADVEARLAGACLPLLARAWPSLLAGTLAFAEQDSARASFCRRLGKEDGVLDFHAAARILASRINGLSPWPSVAIPMGGQPVKVGLADAPEADDARAFPPGTVLGSDDRGLRVAAGRGVLRLLRLQRPGGRMLPAPEFIRGYAVPAGTVLPSGAMPALVAREPFRKS